MTLVTNIRLGCERLRVTNTLAYCDMESVTAIKKLLGISTSPCFSDSLLREGFVLGRPYQPSLMLGYPSVEHLKDALHRSAPALFASIRQGWKSLTKITL